MKRKILLADDSPTIQRLVKQTFEDADFEIVSVSNGEAAIKKFEEIHPSIVLADIYMPGKNGYEVCQYIKQHQTLSGTPVVLLVGAFDAFDEEKAKEAGAASNITKPFEPSSLVELVTTVLAEPPEETVPPAEAKEEDLFGLEEIFTEEKPAEAAPQGGISDEEIDRIADRVIQRLTTQVIENIAWDIVPDITEKIVREELKRIDES